MKQRMQAGLMNILSKMQHKDKAPTNALLAQAVKSCADRGIAYLVYDNYAYGNKQHDGLSEFKERNGFQRVDVPRYYVPLTRFGELALRMGFHHRLADRIPGVHCRTSFASFARTGIRRRLSPPRKLLRKRRESMPGLVGLITRMPRERAEAELLRMVAALRHEPWYVSGTWSDESLGIYVGWVERSEAAARLHAAL